MTAADDLPDDVVYRAAEALYPSDVRGEWHGDLQQSARHDLAALLDAGIVALVPDPDTNTIEALAGVLGCGLGWANETQSRLEREGFTVARLTDVQRREPCDECGGEGIGPTGTTGDYGKDYDRGPCPACGGSGDRPAAPQHDHDPDGCDDCMEVKAEGFREGWASGNEYGQSRPTSPPAGDLPGDGWVRYRVTGDEVMIARQEGATETDWWEGWLPTGLKPAAVDLHPGPEPEPRPTDGWRVEIDQLVKGAAQGWWDWCLYDDDYCVTHSGTEPTREEAEQAAAQARSAWDARLAGGDL